MTATGTADFEPSRMRWSPLLASDIDAVGQIAKQTHIELPERIEVLAEILNLFPSGCCKLMIDGSIVGYGISHPWKLYDIPVHDEFLVELPSGPNCIHIHDVSILPLARGHSAAGSYIALVKDKAQRRRIASLACVSVYGTDVLWQRYGFRNVTTPEMSEKLHSYGPSGKYMIAM